MESQNRRAENKKSLLCIGTLMLCLAALQSPLWRGQQAMTLVTVRNGGATLIAADRPISGVTVDRNEQVSAEVVGEREVLIRGKAIGQAHLTIATQDGRTSTYQLVVQSETARSGWKASTSR
jgi:hypothetical protein